MEKNKHKTLEQIGTELPFEVPANYFDQFASKFEETIAEEHVPYNKILKTWMYFAAMFIGIFVLGQFFYKIYYNNTVSKHDNYEAYVLTQVDEASLLDCYVSDSK